MKTVRRRWRNTSQQGFLEKQGRAQTRENMNGGLWRISKSKRLFWGKTKNQNLREIPEIQENPRIT
jgi:hypothetical protein